MNINCGNIGCPDIIDSSCVFYTGQNLLYIGVNTNDTIETSLQKIDAKIQSVLANSTLQGSGTANRIAKWAASTNLTNSNITDDGTTVTITSAATISGVAILNNILTINKVLPSGSTIFKINSGASSLGSQFEFQNLSDAGLLKIGYFGNAGNRIEIDGGSNNNGSRISLYEKIGSSATTLNIKIDARTDAWTYFNAGNVIIGSNVNSIYKFDVNGNVRIGSGSTDTSAVLHLASTSKGFLKPKMTNTQMLAIASPSTGLEVFNTTNNQSYFYNGTIWVPTGTIQFATTSTYAAMLALSTPTTPTLIKVTTDENKSATRTMYVWFPDGNRQYLLQINDN